jgi:hypothetical protein
MVGSTLRDVADVAPAPADAPYVITRTAAR